MAFGDILPMPGRFGATGIPNIVAKTHFLDITVSRVPSPPQTEVWREVACKLAPAELSSEL